MRKGVDRFLYCLWVDMRNRCRNPNNHAYSYYGGRGITVCERWNVYENFLADVSPYPGNGLTLDRPGNNKGYGPDNFRWATRKEQGRNRNYCKINVALAAFIRSLCAAGANRAALARFYGVGGTTINNIAYGKTWS